MDKITLLIRRIKNEMTLGIFLLRRFIRTVIFKKDRLVMTLLVRDEIDIVEKNITFHLGQGVDHIIATDNGSVDGTRDILKKYEEKGLLHLIDEPSQNYAQAKWVNRMTKIAYKNYNAGFVFHCDADEFWYASSGDLSTEIRTRKKSILKIPVVNVLLCDRGGEEQFPEDTRYGIMKPHIAKNYEEESKNTNMFFLKYPPKVLFFGSGDVSQGNDCLLGVPKSLTGISEDITIYHYPLRSRDHFFQKVINGGKSYAANTELKKDVGFHWRRWFAAYENNSLDEEYKKLIIDKNDLPKFIESGFVEEIFFKDVIDHHLVERVDV